MAGKLHPMGVVSACLNDEGQWIHDLHLMGVSSAFLHGKQEGFLLPVIYPLLYAISLLHCKNVTTRDAAEAPAKVKAARAKRGRPYIHYKELVVKPMRKEVASQTDGDESPIKRALHICRGHFKDYRESGLFGKYHDIYWWEMHVRGSQEVGEVRKSYKVKP